MKISHKAYKQHLDNLKKQDEKIKKWKIIGGFLFAVLFIVALIFNKQEPITPQAVKNYTERCIKNDGVPKYVFKEKGNKESGIMQVICESKHNDSKKKDSLFDDEDPVTATGMPSMSGLPGGPF